MVLVGFPSLVSVGSTGFAVDDDAIGHCCLLLDFLHGFSIYCFCFYDYIQ